MPLTVLQVLPALDAGGVERGTLEVGAELVRRGHRSLVLSGGGRMVESLTDAGSEHFACPIGKKSPFIFRWVPFVRRLLLTEQVDVVHLRSRVPAWVVYLAWKSLPPAKRPRLVTTVHGQYSVSRYSQIMTEGETVVAVSNTIRDYILENYSTAAENIRLIHRGVDPAEFPHQFEPGPEWRRTFFEQHNLPSDPANATKSQGSCPQLLTLPGRITRLKGHAAFISLIEKLIGEGRNVHGLIVGGEHPRKKRYGQELRELISATGMDQHITMTGHRSDMKEIYAVSDIVFSLSSKPESFGRTIVEALALGTPVIGYAHGGVGEILNDEFPLGLVPTGDESALLSTVQRLCDQPVVCDLSGYRLAAMLEKTLSVYEELCTQQRAA